MQKTEGNDIVHNVFVGSPVNKGRIIQPLMYYIFDVGRLGFGFDKGGEDLVKCFKNEVSHIVRSILSNYSIEKIETNDEAADKLVVMSEVLIRDLSNLCDYIFGVNKDKKQYFLKRTREMCDNFIILVRKGEISIK